MPECFHPCARVHVQPMKSPQTLPSSRYFPPVLALFVGSGCASLIYQVVWFQTLQLVIGASAVSLAVLLGTFMGGMCLGSLLLPRFVSPSEHPLRVYAKIEALIGTCGLLLIVAMPLVGRLYTAVDGGGLSSVVLRAIASSILLLPPTILMGATLPAIARYVRATPDGVGWLGFFYGGNIMGAVAGCLVAGFYLLREYDLTTAALAAVVMNFVVALSSLILSKRVPYATAPDTAEAAVRTSGWAPGGVFIAIALSGLTALGAEVVWTRILSLVFGATTYAFSIILAVFLAGLGIGTAVGSTIARTTPNARAALGWTQMFLAFTIAYGAWMVGSQLPYWPVDPALARSPWFNFQIDFARALAAMLPSTVLWGASFPLAVAAAVRPGDDPGQTVGRVYAANTFGAIGGAGLGLFSIPLVGTDGAVILLILAALTSASVVMAPLLRAAPMTLRTISFGLLVVAAFWTATRIGSIPAGLVAWGRQLPWQGEPRALFVGEGIHAFVAVTEDFNGWRNFHVSGKVEASTEPQDMRLQRLLGHLTGLMHEDGPESVLVVGFGSGVTAGALSLHPTVERLVVCELEPLIPEVVATYFSDVNNDVRNDPKVEIVYDDARHYVLTTRETFDVITSDPIHPWVAGAATLYTREYFEHVRARLNPGGVVTQWVPLYESTEESVRSVVRTFLDVFPNGTLWRNDDLTGRGYDMVMVGRLEETPIDIDAWQEKVSGPAYSAVEESLVEVGYASVLDLLATYSGRGPDLVPWVAGAEINTDGNLRLQYLAGIGFNYNLGTPIRDAMLAYRVFPSDLFVGEAGSVEALRSRIMGGF